MQKYKTLLGDEPGLKHNYGSLRFPFCWKLLPGAWGWGGWQGTTEILHIIWPPGSPSHRPAQSKGHEKTAQSTAGIKLMDIYSIWNQCQRFVKDLRASCSWICLCVVIVARWACLKYNIPNKTLCTPIRCVLHIVQEPKLRFSCKEKWMVNNLLKFLRSVKTYWEAWVLQPISFENVSRFSFHATEWRCLFFCSQERPTGSYRPLYRGWQAFLLPLLPPWLNSS